MQTDTLPAVNVARAAAIDGWMSHEELTWLAEQAQKAERIIEIGCWQGRSTRALADHTSGVVYAIDTWQGSDRIMGHLARLGGPEKLYEVFEANLKDHLDAGKVKLWRGESLADSTLSIMSSVVCRSADFVFLDGDHSAETVAAEIAAYQPLIRPGGILAGHDYGRPDHPGVKEAVDKAFPQGVHLVDTIWWVQC